MRVAPFRYEPLPPFRGKTSAYAVPPMAGAAEMAHIEVVGVCVPASRSTFGCLYKPRQSKQGHHPTIRFIWDVVGKGRLRLTAVHA